MRRLLAASVVILGWALLLAGAAAAANGGFTPPAPHSPNAHRINDAYYLILGITGAIFVLVEVSLIVFIIRFRNRGRPRSVEGPQIRGNTSLELGWTVGPVLILAAIAAFVFYKLPGIKDAPPASASGTQLKVTVDARQFYWQFTYPNGVVALDRMRVPADRVVNLDVVSPDVAHSWWIPELGGKIDAIPGRTNHTWFRADKPGLYRGQCAELCGIQHAAMIAWVEALPGAEFDSWLRAEATRQKTASATLGEQEFGAVCAKCHYLRTSGAKLVGPNIGGNPLLNDAEGLADLVRNGRGAMPAVGKGWSDVQVSSLVEFFKRSSGGG